MPTPAVYKVHEALARLKRVTQKKPFSTYHAERLAYYEGVANAMLMLALHGQGYAKQYAEDIETHAFELECELDER